MTLWLRDLLDRVDGMSLRERVMVLAALLGMLALIWDSALMRPLDKSMKSRQPQIDGLRTDIGRLNDTIEQLASQRDASPDKPMLEQAAQTRARLAELDRKIGGYTGRLVSPQEMAEVLKQMLAATPPLRLLSLKTLPAEALKPPGGEQSLPAQLYRHGVQLELEGQYLDLVKFLQALQELPAEFYWQQLDLDATQTPLLKVTITAHTLSESEAWLGV